jgi:phosphoglycolate phosphatase-like HAD superfamily hydrolase
MTIRKLARSSKPKPAAPSRAAHVAPRAAEGWADAAVFVFDVEGTLVDAAMPTLLSWRATLASHGYDVSLADLHRLSGMDGKEMVAQLVRNASSSQRDAVLEEHDKRYREEYLPTVHAFPRVRELFEALKRKGRRIALATDCHRDELDHYLAIAQIENLVDVCACGNDVRHGKPHAELVEVALKRAKAAGKRAVMIGDTPYDAQAAHRAHIMAVGLLTGHFSESDLRDAGCIDVRRDPAALLEAFEAASRNDAQERGAA